MPDEVISPEAAAMRSELDKMLYGLDSDISGFEKKLAIAEGARAAYADAKASVAAAQGHAAGLTAFDLEAVSNAIAVALGSVSDQANKVKSSGVLGALEVIGLKGADQKIRDKAGDILWRVGNTATKLGQWFNRARKVRGGMLEALRVELEQMARVEASWEAGEGAFEAAWKESEEAAGFKVGDPSRVDAKAAARKAAGGDRWDAAAAAVRVTDSEKYLKDRNKRLGAWVSALQKRMNEQLRGIGELRKMVTELQGWAAWVEAQKKKSAAPAAPAPQIFKVPGRAPFAGGVSINIPRSSAPETASEPASVLFKPVHSFLFAFRRSDSRPGTWEVVIEPAAHWAENHVVTDSYTHEEARAIDAVFPGIGATELYGSFFPVPMGWTVAQLRQKLVKGGMRESEELRGFIESHR